MATITLTFPDGVGPRIVDALCAEGGYDQLPDPKPARAVFAKSRIVRFVRETVRNYEAALAIDAARQSATAKADAEVTIS